MTIEARPYGPDSTLEEVREIEQRISVLEPGLLLYREMPVMSAFQLDIFERRLREQGDRNGYRLLVDLSESAPPTAPLRARLKTIFLAEPIKRAAIFTEKNFLINVAAKFVIGSFGLKTWSIHKHRDQALAAVRE